MTTRAPADLLTTAPAEPRLLAGPLLRLVVAEVAYFTAEGAAIYALPLYVTGPVGEGRAAAGLAFGAFAVTALLLRPLVGRLADTRGRRPLLVGGALLTAVSLLLTGLVDDLPAVLVLRLLLGAAEAAFLVAVFATVADLAPPRRVAEATSYASLGLYLGLAAGPPLAELVLRTGGFLAVWSTTAALSVAAAGVLAGLRETRPAPDDAPDPAGHPTATRRRLVHGPSLAPALGFLACTLAMSGFLAFTALHAASVGLTATSLPLTAYGLVVVAGRLVFARAMNQVAPLRLAAAALVAMAAGLALIAAWSSPAGLLAGTVLLAVGVTFSTPAFFAAVFAAAAPSERGAAAGTASAAIDLGLGVGPVLLGVLAEGLGLPVSFAVAGAVALAGALWTARLARTGRWG